MVRLAETLCGRRVYSGLQHQEVVRSKKSNANAAIAHRDCYYFTFSDRKLCENLSLITSNVLASGMCIPGTWSSFAYSSVGCTIGELYSKMRDVGSILAQCKQKITDEVVLDTLITLIDGLRSKKSSDAITVEIADRLSRRGAEADSADSAEFADSETESVSSSYNAAQEEEQHFANVERQQADLTDITE